VALANGWNGAGRAIPVVKLTSRFGSTRQHDPGFLGEVLTGRRYLSGRNFRVVAFQTRAQVSVAVECHLDRAITVQRFGENPRSINQEAQKCRSAWISHFCRKELPRSLGNRRKFLETAATRCNMEA
jgi:hypothetical protein